MRSDLLHASPRRNPVSLTRTVHFWVPQGGPIHGTHPCRCLYYCGKFVKPWALQTTNNRRETEMIGLLHVECIASSCGPAVRHSSSLSPRCLVSWAEGGHRHLEIRHANLPRRDIHLSDSEDVTFSKDIASSTVHLPTHRWPKNRWEVKLGSYGPQSCNRQFCSHGNLWAGKCRQCSKDM